MKRAEIPAFILAGICLIAAAVLYGVTGTVPVFLWVAFVALVAGALGITIPGGPTTTAGGAEFSTIVAELTSTAKTLAAHVEQLFDLTPSKAPTTTPAPAATSPAPASPTATVTTITSAPVTVH
jgi:hypothetical protein